MSPKLWTKERDALLRQLCASPTKPSAPEMARTISAAFGLSLTRAAIVGRCRRLKLKLPREREAKKYRAAPTPAYSYLASPKTRLPEPLLRQAGRGAILPEPQGLRGIFLLNASDDDCKHVLPVQPYTEASRLRVCGEPGTVRGFGGTRYCEACAQKVLREGVSSGRPFVLPTRKSK